MKYLLVKLAETDSMPLSPPRSFLIFCKAIRFLTCNYHIYFNSYKKQKLKSSNPPFSAKSTVEL